MSVFVVEGRKKISGKIEVSGNKNEALPLIAASFLSDKPVTLRNIPDIGDVRTMLEIASILGSEVSKLSDGVVTINASTISSSVLPAELSTKIRASILFASALLARTGKVEIPQPGGDTIGRRRIDTHFNIFRALGAEIETERKKDGDYEILIYKLKAYDGLKGTKIYLDETSVTATENAVIAASYAEGKTVIVNAASEPHVQGLCRFLEKAGVRIEGIGSNILTIYGKSSLELSDFSAGCDYIEAGSFLSLAVSTDSEITITNVDTEFMRIMLFQFERLGISVDVDHEKRMIHIPDKQDFHVRRDIGGAIPRFEDSPWPGLPADMTSIMLVTATQAEGTCLIHEKMFESRLFFVDKLINMGAQIVLCDPHRAVVVGPSKLYGSEISSPDIRAGMALLIAALAADGKSIIHNINQIDRGYERIDERLNALGAQIVRSNQHRRKSDI